MTHEPSSPDLRSRIAKLIALAGRRLAASRARRRRAIAFRNLRHYDARLLRDIGLMQASRNDSIAGFTPHDWADLPPHHPVEDKDVQLAQPAQSAADPTRQRTLTRSVWPSAAVRI